MKVLRTKRFVVTALTVLAADLLQCTVFSRLELAGIRPNLLVIVTAAFGFMRGSKEGMLVGFVSGLLMDIQFGDVIGLYALIYLVTGYINGLFERLYFDDDIKLPILLIASSEFL